MTKPSRRTEWGTPVGAPAGIVHLFSQIAGTRTLGLCGRSLRGDLAIRTDVEPTCPTCVDQRDLAAAGLEEDFEHNVTVRRVQLGYGAVSGAGMRYGAEVRCHTHRDENGHATTVWRSNNSGQLDKARKIADQHLLAAYREHLAQKGA